MKHPNYRDPRYTCAIKLQWNAVLFIEHPTALHWDAGGSRFARRELRAMYRYLGDVEEYPANLDDDLPTLALLYLFIATALIDEVEA